MTTMALKRERLIEAAQTLFYHQGVNRTTLANIAQQAQVPLGNIYYHFRTKEALVEAVIEAHERELQSLFVQWESLSDPRQRILALLAVSRKQESAVVRYGCPHGSLCQELDKEDTALMQVGARIFRTYLDLGADTIYAPGPGRARGEGPGDRSHLIAARHVCADRNLPHARVARAQTAAARDVGAQPLKGSLASISLYQGIFAILDRLC